MPKKHNHTENEEERDFDLKAKDPAEDEEAEVGEEGAEIDLAETDEDDLDLEETLDIWEQ